MEAIKGILGDVFGSRPEGAKFESVFEQFTVVSKQEDHVATSPGFNMFIGFVIIVNSVLTGIEVDLYRGDGLEDRLGFFVCDFFFFLIFFVEMLVRQNQLGWDYFSDPWNVFDYSLVVLNCSDLVISVNADGAAGLKLASTLRALRLLRIVRVVRGLKLFYGLWLVFQGLLESLRTLAWVSLLFIIIVYCLAVGLTTLAGHDEHVREHWLAADMYVGSPWKSMWTVIQVITLDNWATDIARPLNETSPLAVAIIFLAIVVGTFGMANIIVAVMVERLQTIVADNTKQSDKVLERTESELLKAMGEEFYQSDLDGNGELALEEFRQMIRQESMVMNMRLLGIQFDEAESLFDLMDVDKSGAVSPEEFVNGLKKLKGVARGHDLVALISFVQRQCLEASRQVERVQLLNEKADMLQARLDYVGSGLTKEMLDRKQASVRNEEVWDRAAKRQQVIGTLDMNRQIDFPPLKEENARYGILY